MIVKPVYDKTAGWDDRRRRWWEKHDGKPVQGKLIDNPDKSGELVFLPDNLPRGVKVFLYEEECELVEGGFSVDETKFYFVTDPDPNKKGWGVYARQPRTLNLFRLQSSHGDRDEALRAGWKLLMENPKLHVSIQADKETWMLAERYNP